MENGLITKITGSIDNSDIIKALIICDNIYKELLRNLDIDTLYELNKKFNIIDNDYYRFFKFCDINNLSKLIKLVDLSKFVIKNGNCIIFNTYKKCTIEKKINRLNLYEYTLPQFITINNSYVNLEITQYLKNVGFNLHAKRTSRSYFGNLFWHPKNYDSIMHLIKNTKRDLGNLCYDSIIESYDIKYSEFDMIKDIMILSNNNGLTYSFDHKYLDKHIITTTPEIRSFFKFYGQGSYIYRCNICDILRNSCNDGEHTVFLSLKYMIGIMIYKLKNDKKIIFCKKNQTINAIKKLFYRKRGKKDFKKLVDESVIIPYNFPYLLI